jgi:hypothetical protein
MRRDVLLVLTGAAASAGSAAAVELAEVNEDALPQLSNQAQLIRLKPRQEVTKVPRQSLGEEFAVALMRSSYNALESLRCRSMTSFQEDFFFSRQALLPQYNELALPLQMRIGVLEDPLYFDFISSAQYDSIVKGLRNPSDTFEETVGAEVNIHTVSLLCDQRARWHDLCVLQRRGKELSSDAIPPYHKRSSTPHSQQLSATCSANRFAMSLTRCPLPSRQTLDLKVP